MSHGRLDLHVLQQALAQKKARWTAGDTKVSSVLTHGSDLVGYVPRPGEPSRAERHRLARERQREYLEAQAISPVTLPATINWQGGMGQFVTDVKDQGGCMAGSVAFAVTAMIESQHLIQRNCGLSLNMPAGLYVIDLSAAALFFCTAPPGVACGTGWSLSGALDVCQEIGVPDLHVAPFDDSNRICARSDDWGATMVTIEDYTALTDVASMKRALLNGPLVAVMTVFQDLVSYSGGVYEHVTGSEMYDQCLCVIGYDDNSSAWICKNSWGAGWGVGGYCWIGYGQCGIDAIMWGLVGNVLPQDPVVPVYRFFGPARETYFYTIDLGEILQNCLPPGWQFQGVRFYASRLPQDGLVPLYRMYLAGYSSQDHFYTTDPQERASAIAHGYSAEGVAFYVWPTAVAGTMPLYRLLRSGVHVYTTSLQERNALQSMGYTYEEIAGYVAAS